MNGSFNQLICLYIEDDIGSRQVMEVLLTRIMRVKKALVLESSHTLPTLIQEIDSIPHIVFLDIRVEPYNGYEMLEMIRRDARWQNTCVIAVTASVMADEVEKLKRAGFDSLIAKPLNPDIFPEYVERILAGETMWSVIWDE